jgi:c-di-AMP phosphodiesterase-like protein
MSSVIANKNKIVTSEDIFNKIFIDQFIELAKNTFSYTLGALILKLIMVVVFDPIQHDKIATILILILIIFCTVYICLELFTYLKIKNNQDKYLEDLTKTK